MTGLWPRTDRTEVGNGPSVGPQCLSMADLALRRQPADPGLPGWAGRFQRPATFHTHFDFGRVVVVLLTLLLPIVAWVGQLPTVRLAAGILLFYLVQTGLPEVRASLPMVAALHPVLGARPLLARRATRERGAARLVRSRSEPPRESGESSTGSMA